MCLISKCFFCIPLNVGALILGYLGAITYGIICAAVIVTLIMTEVAISNAPHINLGYIRVYEYDLSYEQHKIPFGLARSMFEAACAVMLIIFGLAFMFSAFLIHGIHMERAGYVKAYFVYGVVVATLDGLAVIFGFIGEVTEIAGIMLCILAVYVHCLMVVYSAYRGIQSGRVFREPFKGEESVPNVYQHV